MKSLLAAAAVLAVATPMLAPGAAVAATLEVVSGTTGARGAQIAAYGPIGQSFVAIDTNLTSFGFQFQTFNADAASAPVTWRLLAGAGLNGAVVSTRTLNLPTTLPDRTGLFYDFDITGTNVTVGQTYTAVVSTGTTRYGIALGPEYNIYTGVPLGGDAYAGGRAYFATSPFSNCTADASSNCDLNFRVTGSTPAAAAAVPEPAGWALMLGGFALTGGALRRRRATVTCARTCYLGGDHHAPSPASRRDRRGPAVRGGACQRRHADPVQLCGPVGRPGLDRRDHRRR